MTKRTQAIKRIYSGRGIELYRGDCLQAMEQMKRRGVEFDAVMTDPPYSSGGLHLSSRQKCTNEKYRQTGHKIEMKAFLGDNMDQRSYRLWAMTWLGTAAELLKPGGLVCLFTDWRQLPTMTDILQGAGLNWCGIVPWDKKNTRPRIGGFNQRCEFIVWGTKGTRPRVGPSLPGAYQMSPVSTQRRVHFAEKPVELMKQLLRAVSESGGESVLDPFAGGATTLVAARELGLRAVGIEKSEAIAEDARQRLKAKPEKISA
ncbi:MULTISPECIES: DNA-methyltransferase [Pirellulaceae]|nr:MULTISPECIES: DNA methyltransferase [Pirellulaceae]